MKGLRVRKEPGLSWIEIDNQVHEFASGGQQHPRREAISAKLEELIGHLKQMGYVPEISLSLHDIEEEHKEEQLYHHSEKLALAFAMMNEDLHCGVGVIRIVKNIRICVDCHNFMKLASDLSPCSPFRPSKPLSWEQSVLQMQAKDQARVQYLSSLVARKSSVPIASGRQVIQSPTYIVRANIGTPSQTMLMALDTSNDAAWVPCDGCVGCSSTVFQTTNSTTFKLLDCQASQCKQVPNPTCGGTSCGFNFTYGGSSLTANLVQDTLTLASDPIPGYTFSCVQTVTGSSIPPQGLLGLGRGPLSLLSQSQNLYQSTFSYCLPSFKALNFSGSLRLGPVGQPKRIKTTPLLKNPRRPSLYYVNLIGIRVGSKVVDIPQDALAFNSTTGAGSIFDSGTVYTRLVEPAYIAVRDEFRRRVGKNLNITSLGGFDTCYTVPIVSPTITFMFDGMNVTLPQDNFLIHSTAGSTTCLAMAAAPNNVNSVLNVIANFQQQNHRIFFDVANSRVGVAREPCS